MSKPAMPEIEVEMWEYDDGTVGGRLAAMPDGEIHAHNATTLQRGIAFIMNTIIDAELLRVRTGSTQGKFEGGMEAMWIDGKFCVRFLPVVGFGVQFDVEEMLQPWLRVFLDAAFQGIRNKRLN